jgi:hypothetical protein
MPALDLDFSGSGLATSQDPSVQAMRQQQTAADAERRKQIHQDAMQRIAEQEAQQRATMLPLEMQQKQQEVEQGQRRATTETMRNDLAQWPSVDRYRGIDYAHAPAEVAAHVIKAYPGAAAEAPAAWNQAQRDVTGEPVGVNVQPGQQARASVAGVETTFGKPIPAPKPKLHDAIVAKLIDRGLPPTDENGEELDPVQAIQSINSFDQKNGILSKAQETIANATASRMNSSRNPAVAGYYKLKPKYDSIRQNVQEKPMDQRNGVDDANLLNAAAGIENVDRAPTQNDYKELLRAAGLRGGIDVSAERLWGLFNGDPKYYENRGTRILPDAMLGQILENAKRIVGPRKDLFLKAIEPMRENLRQHGIPEERVFPMGLIDEEDAAQGPVGTPGPNAAVLKWLKENPNDPRAPAARAAIGQ